MALHWLWKDKVGTAYIQHKSIEYQYSLYQGNAYLIFIYEYEEEGQSYYQLHRFLADKDHAKNMLGLNKKDGYTMNEFDQESEKLVKVRLKKSKLRKPAELIGLLVQAFDSLVIELSEDDPEETEEYPETDFENC